MSNNNVGQPVGSIGLKITLVVVCVVAAALVGCGKESHSSSPNSSPNSTSTPSPETYASPDIQEEGKVKGTAQVDPGEDKRSSVQLPSTGDGDSEELNRLEGQNGWLVFANPHGSGGFMPKPRLHLQRRCSSLIANCKEHRQWYHEEPGIEDVRVANGKILCTDGSSYDKEIRLCSKCIQ